MRTALFTVVAVFLLASCSGSNDGPSRGFLVDSGAQGVEYLGNESGVTGPNGEFFYRGDDPVVFKLGNIILGRARPARFVTPSEFMPDDAATPGSDALIHQATNTARLLQTLDEDCDPSNGLNIPPQALDLAEARSLQLRQTPEAFGNDPSVRAFLNAVLASGGQHCFELVGAEQALAHLNQTRQHIQTHGEANFPPRAAIRGPETAESGSILSLVATASDDDGEVISVAWTQQEGPEAQLTNDTTRELGVALPSVNSITRFRFAFKAIDDDGASHRVSHQVLVRPQTNNGTANHAPIARNASFSTEEEQGLEGILTGDDEDGDALDFSVVSAPSHGQLTLTNAGAFSYQPAVNFSGVDTFSYRVADASAASSPATVTLVVNEVNDLPTVSAGPDATILAQSAHTLAGEAEDIEGPVSVSWVQDAGPAVDLNLNTADGTRSLTPGFIAPEVAETTVLLFTLAATDSHGARAQDSVSITVLPLNQAPVALASAPQRVDEQTPVTLDGSGSSDEDGTIQAFEWRQTDTSGYTISIENPDQAQARFTSPVLTEASTLHFTLTVTDNRGESASDSVAIEVTPVNTPPLADAGADQSVQEGDSVILDGRHSQDPDGNLQHIVWQQIDSSGIPVSLSTADQLLASFTAPEVSEATTLSFQLSVTDNEGATQTDTADITVNPAPRPINTFLVGSAKRSVTPDQVHIDGIPEERLAPGNQGTITHVQKFNLGGFGINPTQNFPDPIGSFGENLTEPASERRFEGSQGPEDTWVRVLALQQADQDGNLSAPVIFIALDAVGAGNVIQNHLRAAVVAANPEVSADQIVFGQTHTHAGADLQGLWGGVPLDWIENTLYVQAANAVSEALAGLTEVDLKLAQGEIDEFNRYRRPPRDPNADADTTGTLLRAYSKASGQLVGSILQFNAHPVSINEDPRVPHADYILGAMDWLERDGGTALYFNGPIADASTSGARPDCVEYASDADYGNVRCKGEGMAEALQQIARGERDGSVETDLAPTLNLNHQTVYLPVTNPAFVAAGLLGSFNRYYDFLDVGSVPQAGPVLSPVLSNLPQLTPVASTRVTRITIGGSDEGLEIVTIPGEATNTFGEWIQSLAAPNAKVMLMGLTQNAFGYILPEEEYHALDESGDTGFVLPYTGYEEYVSLGPLTAPLLRMEGYVPLFAADPVAYLPPSLAACQDGPDSPCLLTDMARDIEYLQDGLATQCRSQGGEEAEAFCAQFDPDTPLAQQCTSQGFSEEICQIFGDGSAEPEQPSQPDAASICEADPSDSRCPLSIVLQRLDPALVESCSSGNLSDPSCVLSGVYGEMLARDPGLAACADNDDSCLINALSGAAGEPGPKDQAIAADAVTAQVLGCDMLDPHYCMYPFPSDHFTTVDPFTDTGKRIDFNVLAMPRNVAGKPIDPTEWNRNDGYSPGQMIQARIPGLDLHVTDQFADDGRGGHVAMLDRMSNNERDNASSAVMVFEVQDDGRLIRHPVFAEIDVNRTAHHPCAVGVHASEVFGLAGQDDARDAAAGFSEECESNGGSSLASGSPAADPGPALLIRPAKNFSDGKRYIVALRNLLNSDVQRIEAPEAFQIYRDELESRLPAVNQRRAQMEDLLVALSAAGVDRSSLYLAWDFTVASTRNLVGRLLHMRDDALYALDRDGGENDCIVHSEDANCAAPKFVIDRVEDDATPSPGDTRRKIFGRLFVPSYLTTPDSACDAPTDPVIAGVCDAARQAAEQAQQGGDPVTAQLDQIIDPLTNAAALPKPYGRLFYEPDHRGPWGDGLPDRLGRTSEMPVEFVCSIPLQPFEDSSNKARPNLYGHGLLGGKGEGEGGSAMNFARHQNRMPCAIDWIGMSTGDIVNVAAILTDVSHFPVLADRSQQGFVNWHYLTRALLHHEGFVSHPAFQFEGEPLYDNSEVYYDGNSQGGIMGGAVLATSPDIRSGTLGVFGMNYSTLLRRSVDFDAYGAVMYSSYRDSLDQSLVLSMMQMLWDRAETNGYANHMSNAQALRDLGHPTPDHRALIHVALGDHQVADITGEVGARSMQAAIYSPTSAASDAAQPGRHPARAEAYWGIDVAPEGHTGSALVIWDSGPIGSGFGGGTQAANLNNTPPDQGRDPHGDPRNTVRGFVQKGHFMSPQGSLAYTCKDAGGRDTACFSRDSYSGGAAGNQPPTITLAAELSARAGNTVQVLASAQDSNHDGLVMHWTQTGGPMASDMRQPHGAASLRFEAPDCEAAGGCPFNMSFELSVNDGFSTDVTASVVVTLDQPGTETPQDAFGPLIPHLMAARAQFEQCAAEQDPDACKAAFDAAVLAGSGEFSQHIVALAARAIGEQAGLDNPPQPKPAPNLHTPDPLKAGIAQGAIDVPVGTPLGGYLRPPVGGDYVPSFEAFGSGDPQPFIAELVDFQPYLVSEACDPQAQALGGCTPLAPLPDELRTAHAPYATLSPPSRGYYHSLIAKAVALYDGQDHVVMVKTDFIGMLDELVQDIRQEVADRTGIDLGDGLIMSANHSHHGPGALANHSTRYFWLAMDIYQHDVYRKIVGQLADVVEASLGNMRTARIGHASAQETAGLNGYRRGSLSHYDILQRDRLRTRLGVLRIDAIDQAQPEPLALIVNWAAHGISFDIENQFLSGDVLGATERATEDLMQHPMVMLVQSVGGDVSPRGKIQDNRLQRIESYGARLAPQIKAIADGIHEFQLAPDLRAVSQRIILNRERLGYSPEEYPYPWGAGQCNNGYGAPIVGGFIPGHDEAFDYVAEYSGQERLPYCLPSPPPDTLDLMDNGVAENGAFYPQDTILAAARIGDITLMVQPGEPLVQYGVELMNIAQSLGFAYRDTFVWGYSADHIGYILPAEEEDWLTLGGAESTTTFWGWKQGQRFMDVTEQLLLALRDEAPAPTDEFKADYQWYRQILDQTPRAQPQAGLFPGLILQQPEDIRRFEATAFVFEGGDPIISTPTITMQMDRDTDGDGTGDGFVDVTRPNGEPLNTLSEMQLRYRQENGRHIWRVMFEAPRDWPLNVDTTCTDIACLERRFRATRYRFRVEGLALNPATAPAQGGLSTLPYAATSDPFQVQVNDELLISNPTIHGDGAYTFSVDLAYPARPDNYRVIDPWIDENHPAVLREPVTFYRSDSGGGGTQSIDHAPSIRNEDGILVSRYAISLGSEPTVGEVRAVDRWGNFGVWSEQDSPPLSGTSDHYPSLTELCEAYGLPEGEALCSALRDVQQAAQQQCEDNGGRSETCSLSGGNLHGVLAECQANGGSDAYPVCNSADVFMQALASYCRSAGDASQDALKPEACALLGGIYISDAAIAEFVTGPIARALNLQYELNASLPMKQWFFPSTHNSFNHTSANTPPTLSGSDSNQFYSIVDQLRMGIRGIEIDVHWMPSPLDQSFRPTVCHGNSQHFGCTYERSLATELTHIAQWLDAHPDQVIVIDLEDNMSEPFDDYPEDADTRYALAAQVLRDRLGDRLFTPGEYAVFHSGESADGQPLNATLNEVRSRGQVIIYTTRRPPWNDLVFGRSGTHEQSGSGSWTGMTADNCTSYFTQDQYANRWVRMYEDATLLGGFTGASTSSFDEVVGMTRCGVNMPSLDRIHPDDPRLRAFLWSWAEGEPTDAGQCAAMVDSTGRFVTRPCLEQRAAACRSTANPGQWAIGASATFAMASQACPDAHVFAAPRNGPGHEALKAARARAGGPELWVNYMQGPNGWAAP